MSRDRTQQQEPVGRDDIEAKLRQIRGEVDRTTEAAKPTAMYVGAAAVAAVVVIAFVLGARRGKKRTTVVEVRRI